MPPKFLTFSHQFSMFLRLRQLSAKTESMDFKCNQRKHAFHFVDSFQLGCACVGIA